MIRKTLAVAVPLALWVACGDSTEPRVPTTLQVDQQSVSLAIGDTVRVGAVVLDQDGRPFDVPPTGFAIVWSTTNANVATVADGLITATGSGLATVSATAGTLAAAEVQVSVDALAQIAFSFAGHSNGNFQVSETLRLDDIDWEGDVAVTAYVVDDGEPWTDIVAQRQRADGKWDFIWFYVHTHVTSLGTRAAGGELGLGFDPATETWESWSLVTGGSVTHNAVSSVGLGGTFTLQLEHETTGAALNVTQGTFNLPLVPQEVIFGEPAALDGAGPGATAMRDMLRQRARAVH